MGAEVSDKSKRVAKNTLLLYFRMLLLMLIGLYTSRVVLNALGVEDYGTYNVVNSIVMMFTVISNSISSSIGRFLAFEIGTADREKLRKVFSSAIFIQTGFCILLILLAETLGLWYLREKVIIPPGRESAAFWVFQASVLMLAIQLFSIPFNSTIIAHEDMKAFAWISIVEGILKLLVAFVLLFATWDKLIVYAVLMVAVAFSVRGIYAFYCKRHFEESRGALVWDRGTLGPMLSLGAWSFTAHGVGVFNTQGVNLLSNVSFGVCINAVRGIAGQVENIVKQFVANFLTALNPLITKTWAEDNREYCFALVRKGSKFSCLIVLLFLVPFAFEADFILKAWLGNVPEHSGTFTILAIACIMADMMSNSMAQLIISKGKVAAYYIITSTISAFTFIGTWIAFRNGCPPESCYYISAVILICVGVTRLIVSKKLCGFPIRTYFVEVVIPVVITVALSFALAFVPEKLLRTEGTVKSLVCIVLCLVVTAVCSYLIALTKGERSVVNDYFKKIFRR